MTSEIDKPQPTMADEQSPVVDDRVVIEKTLPTRAPDASAERSGSMDRILAHTREFVSANPVRGALMVAGLGALIAKLIVLSHRRPPRRHRQPW